MKIVFCNDKGTMEVYSDLIYELYGEHVGFPPATREEIEKFAPTSAHIVVPESISPLPISIEDAIVAIHLIKRVKMCGGYTKIVPASYKFTYENEEED